MAPRNPQSATQLATALCGIKGRPSPIPTRNVKRRRRRGGCPRWEPPGGSRMPVSRDEPSLQHSARSSPVAPSHVDFTGADLTVSMSPVSTYSEGGVGSGSEQNPIGFLQPQPMPTGSAPARQKGYGHPVKLPGLRTEAKHPSLIDANVSAPFLVLVTKQFVPVVHNFPIPW